MKNVNYLVTPVVTHSAQPGKQMEVEELKEKILTVGNLPQHIAIIMDGNGRWAKRRSLPRRAGHREGVRAVRRVVEAAGEIGIKYLSLYVFSSENWRRPEEEVGFLMRLLEETARKEIQDLNRNNVRLTTIGRFDELPNPAKRVLKEGIDLTSKNSGLTLILALNYGSRIEITDGVKKLAQEVKDGKLGIDRIEPELISKYLYTAPYPDPDLLIRTSGEQRISNFLLWQIAYAELYITETLWPDFGKKELFEAILSYQERERRFGAVSQ
jgi:undecaprenyl diphosphate synthase